MATTQLSLKLLIDTRSKRVLFAEAGEDVVDFLFSLLSMPAGSIIKLLTKERMVGSLGNIYKSVEDLDEKYIEANRSKAVFLDPTYDSRPKNAIFLTGGPSSRSEVNYYKCNGGSIFANPGLNCSGYITNTRGTRCPRCNSQMTEELTLVDPQPGKSAAAKAATSAGGFVKGVVTYTVMDDLTVTPMSTISSITLLNRFSVRDLSSLEERTVNLGLKEGLELLKASLQSKMVLTDVFLGTKAEPLG